MNIRNFDLNLLVILKDLLLTKNVSLTASNLGLSQPAVSHALKRLRYSLDDELFIRIGKKLTPTERALELGHQLSAKLNELEDLIYKREILEPKTLEKSFTISGTSYDSMIWFPRLMAQLREEAPSVVINFKGIILEKYLERMTSGEVDLSFAGNIDGFNNFKVETLAEHDFCIITNKANRKFKSKMTLSNYLSAQHVVYTPTEMPGSEVDDILEGLGKERNINIRTPYLNSIPELVLQRDYLAIVPTFYAKYLKKLYPIKLIEPPIKLTPFKHQMIWHKSKDKSLEHEWFRNCIRKTYKM